MLLGLVLALASSTAVLATCPLPAEIPLAELPTWWNRTGDLQISISGSYIHCLTLLGQLGPGSKPVYFFTNFQCDAAKSKWVDATTGYEAPPIMSCGYAEWTVPTSEGEGLCEINDQQASGAVGKIIVPTRTGDSVPAKRYCPAGTTPQYADGRIIKNMACPLGTESMQIETEDGVISTTQNATLKCVPVPTTTTTLATTTVPADITPSAAQLWNVMFYYNFALGVHAYCADSTCIKAIQSNGIGYDMVNGKGSMGRAVTESAIGAVRAACPTGSQNLRNLGFTKSGYKYLHNFNGLGLKQGWVAIVKGACGATNPVKRWKSRYTDDMMYGYDLEWNKWYKGMVQDGGKVKFMQYSYIFGAVAFSLHTCHYWFGIYFFVILVAHTDVWKANFSDSKKRKMLKAIRYEMIVHHVLTLISLLDWNNYILISNIVLDVYNLCWWLTFLSGNIDRIATYCGLKNLIFIFMWIYTPVCYILDIDDKERPNQ